MKLYRIETPQGEGVFTHMGTWALNQAAVDAGLYPDYGPEDDGTDKPYFHSTSRGFPGPFADGALNEHADRQGLNVYEGRYAFTSLKEARRWFPRKLVPALENNEQTLTVWDVPAKDVARSPYQAVFRPNHAKLVARLPVSALYSKGIARGNLTHPKPR